MPYVPSGDRPELDEKVAALAAAIVANLKDVEVSTLYKRAFNVVSSELYLLETGQAKDILRSDMGKEARALANQIFEVAKKYGYRGAWLGELNYSLTRLIQVVPKMMVEKGAWREELRYWLYAQTVGALERSALDIDAVFPDDWITDGLVGVAIDVKDEYKRRVNTAYEAAQIKKSGDCYDTPYRTVLVEVKDGDGKVVGYQEVMKDFRQK